jgi:hypothetical protein
MLLLQSHFGERVADVGIEACRDQHEIRLEFDQAIQGMVNSRRVSVRIALRRDGPIEDIPPRDGPGAWITGMLMNRRKPYSFITEDGIFRTVAVMRIKIPDGHALAPHFERVMRGNRN